MAIISAAAVCVAVGAFLYVSGDDSSEFDNSIDYELNGGTNSPDNPGGYDDGASVSFSEPTRDGYEFTGWYTDSGLTQKTWGVPAGSDGDVTVYAGWVLGTYDIDYVLNGVANDPANPSTYTYGDAVTLRDGVAEKGYTFTEWYTDEGLTQKFAGIVPETFGDLTLYAGNPDTYRITYELNGGFNNWSNPTEYDYNTAVDLADPSKTGNDFKGWYTDAELTNGIETIAPGTAGDLTLYAKWAPATYGIKYFVGGEETDVGGNPSQYTYGDTVELRGARAASGKLFVAWYSDSMFINRLPGITPATHGDLTLYAKFVPDLTNMQYELMGEMKETSKSLFSTVTKISTLTVNYTKFEPGKGFYVVQTADTDGESSTRQFWSEEDGTAWMNKGTETIDWMGKSVECDVRYSSESSGPNKTTQTQYIGVSDGRPYKVVIVEGPSVAFLNVPTVRSEYNLILSRTSVPTDHEVKVYAEGGITAGGGGDFSVGEEVTVTAEAGGRGTFGGWYDGHGKLLSSETTYSFEMALDDVIIVAANGKTPDMEFDNGRSHSLEGVTGLDDLSSGNWTIVPPEGENETVRLHMSHSYDFEHVGTYLILFDGFNKNGTEVHWAGTALVSGSETRDYTFSYDDTSYHITLDIKEDDYKNAVSLMPDARHDTYVKTHWTNHDTAFVIKDPADDAYLKSIADQILKICKDKGYTSAQDEANMVLAFTQYIEYAYDADTHGVEEYWNFPLETLWLQKGDCEDTSILFCAISQYMDGDGDGKQDYGTALFLMSGHMAAGAAIDGFVAPATSGDSYNTKITGFKSGGTAYYYCETTGEGWLIGQVPSSVGINQSSWIKTYENYLIAVMPVTATTS